MMQFSSKWCRVFSSFSHSEDNLICILSLQAYLCMLSSVKIQKRKEGGGGWLMIVNDILLGQTSEIYFKIQFMRVFFYNYQKQT